MDRMIKDLEQFQHHLRVGHLNTVSVPKHQDEIVRVVVGADLDIFLVCETNIKANTPTHRFRIPGYKLLRVGAKGGVGAYFKEIYKPKKIDLRYGSIIKIEHLFLTFLY